MRLRSFRLRLALISASSAAVGLLVFGIAVAGLWRKHRITRIDEELTRRGHVLASQGVPAQAWSEVYRTMQSFLGEEDRDSHFLGIRRASDATLVYQSPNWPQDLEASLYPASNETFEWRGSARDFFRPKGFGRRRGTGQANQPDDPDRRQRRELFPRRGPQPIRILRKPVIYEVRHEDQHWRLGVFGNKRNEVLLGAHLGEFHREQKSLWLAFATASTGALALIALGAWLLSRKALSPVEALTEATRRVSASDLGQRIDLPQADREFLPLIRVYNNMMERLENSFHQATRFSADASHELKTPIAIMQGTLERALAESAPGSKEQTVYTSLLEETDHQQAILQSLLLLSRADAGKLSVAREHLSLSELALRALDDAEMMGEDRTIAIQSEIQPSLFVKGDPILLQQVLHNLLTNAVKYNKPHGWVRLLLKAEATEAVLRVSNSGTAIPREAQSRLFERFYRVEAARSSRKDGIGLGLSLSLELVKAHGGSLTLESSTNEETVFELRLPLASPEGDPS